MEETVGSLPTQPILQILGTVQLAGTINKLGSGLQSAMLLQPHVHTSRVFFEKLLIYCMTTKKMVSDVDSQLNP